MGVRGLLSWLTTNKDQLGEKSKISNQQLIIDANNLYATIFTRTVASATPQQRNDIYGGDLVSLSSQIRAFFAKLELCKIKARLVFDGSVIGNPATKNWFELKTSEIIKRGRDRIVALKELTEDNPPSSEFIKTVLMKDTFKQLVFELNIECDQAPYEADEQAAYIANKLNCPILTNDSDFMIYNVYNGLITIDSILNETPKLDESSNNYYLETCIFKHSKLRLFFPGLQQNCMAILSVLIGNVYIPPKFFKQIGLVPFFPNSYRNLSSISKSHKNIVSCLIWLSKKSLGEASTLIKSELTLHIEPQQVDRIINTYNKPEIPFLIKELKKKLYIKVNQRTRQCSASSSISSKSSNSTNQKSCNIEEEFKSKLIIDEQNNKQKNIDADNNNSIASLVNAIENQLHIEIAKPKTDERNLQQKAVNHLLNIFRKSCVPSILLDILFGNMGHTYPIIDDLTKEPSSYIKYRAIGIAMSLLKIKPLLGNDEDEHSKQLQPFVMLDRVGVEFGKTLIAAVHELPNFGSLKHITIFELLLLTENEKKTILLDTFRIKNDKKVETLTEHFNQVFKCKEYSRQLAILFLITDFILQEDASSTLDDNFILALLTTVFYYSADRGGELNTDNIDESAVESLCAKLHRHKQKDNDFDYNGLSLKFDYKSIMRALSQLTFALEGYSLVNSILGLVYPQMEPQKFFNGTLIVRLTRMFKADKLITRQMLENDVPKLYDLANTILTKC